MKPHSLQSTCDDLATQQAQIAEMIAENVRLAKLKQQEVDVILAPKNITPVTTLAGLVAELEAAKVVFAQIGTDFNASRAAGRATDGAKVQEAYDHMVGLEKKFNEQLSKVNPQLGTVFDELIDDLSGATAQKEKEALEAAQYQVAIDEAEIERRQERPELDRSVKSAAELQTQVDKLNELLLKSRVQNKALEDAQAKLKQKMKTQNAASAKPAGFAMQAPAAAPKKRRLNPAQKAALAAREAKAQSAPATGINAALSNLPAASFVIDAASLVNE
jgi:hypothetical protein